jgi:hypothetical protein
MAAIEVFGTGVQQGAALTTVSATLTNYILESATEGGKNVDFEDVFDSDGKRVTRIVFNRELKLTLTLICKTSATPTSDFPEGDKSTITGLTTFYVDSCALSRVKGANKVTVTLSEIFVSA